MAEWQLINLATDSNGVWTQTSCETIANLVDGQCKMAYADLGIESITVNYWYVNIQIDTTQTDVPLLVWDGCVYGVIGWSIGGYYNPGSFSIITLDTNSVYVSNLGGGDHGCGGAWVYLEGDGFTAFKQVQKTSAYENAKWVYDTALNAITGDTVPVLIDTAITDILNGVHVDSSPITAQSSTQNDGSLYVEVVKLMCKGGSPVTAFFVADHTYYPVWDYDTARDKNVLINGVKFNRMGTSYMYVPVE